MKKKKIGYASDKKAIPRNGKGKGNKMKKTILLGIKNNELITADIDLRDWNGRTELGISFNEGQAFNINDIDEGYTNDYFNDLWDYGYDAQTKLDLLQDGEITKEEVFQDWKEDTNYYDIKDCSCTDYELTKNGKTINFETIGCGQTDVRTDEDFNDMKFTDEKLFNDIMYYWDNFHLKELDEEQVKEIREIVESIYCDEEDGFYNFITNNIDWNIL